MKSYALMYAAREIVTEGEAKKVIRAILKRAQHGDVKCADLLFRYLVGTPTPMQSEDEEKPQTIALNITLTGADETCIFNQ